MRSTQEGLVASAEGAATAHPACGAAWAAGGQVGKVGGASEMGLEGDARERERERAPLAAPRAAGRAEAAEAAAEATNRLGQARCAHVLPRKGRRCGLTAVCGEFCAAHAQGGDRVACMHCGTPVASAAMEKHVRKCPAAVRVARRDAQPWHSAGINRAARRGVAVRSPALTEFSTCELRAALEAVDKALAAEGWDVPLAGGTLRPAQAEQLLSGDRTGRALTGGHVPPMQLKHAAQGASFLGHMLERGVLPRAAACDESAETLACVEFGAGRGYLSMMVAAGGPRRFVMVDRDSFRLKADRALRAMGGDVDRLRADLADVRLAGVKSLRGRRVVCVGKHVCGVGTDYALRCAVGLAADAAGSEADAIAAAGARLCGVAMAPCCHHRCLFEEYVNQQLLSKHGISLRLFQAIAKMSSWGTTATAAAAAGKGHSDIQGSEEIVATDPDGGGHTLTPAAGTAAAAAALGLDEDQRIAMGVRCKRLLDCGRAQWLKEKLAILGVGKVSAEVVRYAEESVSPENRLVVVSATDSD